MDKSQGRVSRRRFGSKELKREERVSGSNTETKSCEVRERRARNRQQLLEMLHVKLRSFEEDTIHMKKAVVRCVKERALLMSEIARQLQLLGGYVVGLQGGNSSDAAFSSFASTVKVCCYLQLAQEISKPSLSIIYHIFLKKKINKSFCMKES